MTLIDHSQASLSVDDDGACAASGLEVEVKFRADEAQIGRLLESSRLAGQVWTTMDLSSVYFDTRDGDLRKAGLSLRLRAIGNRRVMGLKRPSGRVADVARRELEIDIAESRPVVAAFGKDVARELRVLTGRRSLEPQFEVAVRRRTTRLAWGDSDIEVAVDRGRIRLGRRHIPLSEVELELKAGATARLFACASELCDEVPMRLGLESKADQGYRALNDEKAPAVKARPLRLRPGDTLDRSIAATLSAALSHFSANWPCLEQSNSPDGVHQMRVGLRRLRVALALFRRAAPCPEFTELESRAKRFAAVLGDARDWDIFIRGLREGPLRHPSGDGAIEALLTRCDAHRADAYAKARDLIASEEATRFVLDARRFIAARGWRAGAGALPREFSEKTRDFAVRQLRRLDKRALKRGRRLATLEPSERHRLRIALKKLRYAAEFFEGLFGKPNRTRRYLDVIGRLQDELGAFNDMAVAGRLLDRVAMRDDPGAERAAGLALGWTAHALMDAEAKIAASWRDFKHARRFWA